MRYRAFRTKKDNQFYFQFMTDGGDVVMKSQAYASKADCFNGIRSVMENASNPDRYETIPGDGGTFAFKLKAGNNVEIGRSVDYSSEEELNNMIALFQTNAPKANSGDAKPAKESKPEVTKAAPVSSSDGKGSGAGGGSKTDDDYRPLAFYESRISGVENGFDTFTDTEGNEHYFTYNVGGKVVLISEGYNSESGRDNGINSVTKNMTNPDRYKRGIHKNGKHYFGLRAGNNQEIGTSRWCDTEEEMNGFISAMTGASSESATVVKSSMASSKKSSSKETKAKPERTYLAQGGKYPCSNITYDTFKSGGNDRYYFVFKSEEDKAVLINGDVRGFETEDDLNKGVDKVMILAPDPANYLRKASKNGKHYFYVVDGETNIARGSLFYDDEADMEETIKMIACGAGMVKATAPASSATSKDEYLACEAYGGEVGFHTFENDGEYYFGYNSANGRTLLRSEGYTTEKARDNGIESVKKNAPLEERWTASEDDGQFYYALKAGNHQEIARSCPYGTTVERNTAYAAVYDAFAEKPEVVAAMSPGGATSKDEYLACEAYAGETGFHTFENEGEYYFGYNNADGKTLLRSEGYTTEKARDNGIESVKKNGPLEERWTASEDNDQYYYALKAGNHQEIARSCPYGSIVERNTAYAMAYDAFAEKPEVVAAMSAGGGTNQDEYLPCEAYAGASGGFHTFTNDDNGEHYFSYNDNSGQVLLRSEGYTTEKARDNGIESVKKNGSIEKRWSTGEEGGQHYYALKAGNHQEIARSCFFASEDEMNRAYNLATYAFAEKPEVVESAPPPPKPEPEVAKAVAPPPPPAPEPPKAEKIVDDYMPCEAYNGAAGFHSFFDDNRKEYFFAYNDEDGNTLLRSEGYKTAAARDNGIESVKKNAPVDGRWKKETALNGKYHYYVLRAGNNQEIARSCYYEDREQMSTNFMMLGGAFAPIAAGTVVSSMTTEKAPPPPPKEKEDDYMPCKEYEGRKINDKQNNVALFKHDNGQFYFVIYHPDGSVRLRSEGFQTNEGRDVELSGVLKNLDDKKMYSRIERGDYYIDVLKDKTGREVGRSCLQKVAPPPPPPPKEKEDDYLKCKEYANRKVNDKVNNVALFKHDNGQYYFAVYNTDGSVRLRSEGFRTAKGRDQELSGVLKNMNNKDMYETIQRGSYYINVLKDDTGREVGRSCMKKEKVAVVPPAVVAGGLAAGLAGAGAAAGKVVEKKKKAVVVPPPVKRSIPVAAAAAASTVHKEEKKKGGFAWWWLLPLLLLIPLLLWLRGCEGCNTPPPPPPPPVTVDTTKQEPPPAPVKTALCPAAGDLKLAAGSGANVASYLSDPESTYPKRFTFDNVGFRRNAARLNSAGKKSLDDLAVCLKGCENTNVDIYGYIGEKERSSYRGSKEVSLDDVRARNVYNYLKSLGIDESRMSFQGEGTGDSSNIVIQIGK